MEAMAEYMLGAMGAIIIFIFNGMRTDIKKVVGSVETLNIQIAEVIKDMDWHKAEIKELKHKVDSLESKAS